MKKIIFSAAMLTTAYTMAQNTGIGTTNPQAKLEVVSEISSAANLVTKTGTGVINFSLIPENILQHRFVISTNRDLQNTKFLAFSPTNNVETKLVIDHATGNIGFGDIYPWARLHLPSIGNNLRTSILVTSAEPAFKISTYQGVTGPYSLVGQLGLEYHNRIDETISLNSMVKFYRGGSDKGGSMAFTSNDDTEVMRIAANNNVGIGTTKPAEKLDVVGNIKSSKNIFANGLGGENAYLGGDGAPGNGGVNDVQLGSTKSAITDITLWNSGSNQRMNLFSGKTNSYQVGAGTDNPTAGTVIDAVGKVRIADGTQQSGRVLTSDNNGVASWEALSIGNKVTQLAFNTSSIAINTVNYDQQTASTPFTTEVADSVNVILNENNLTYTNSQINLPTGKYFIFLNHDIPAAEYARISVVKNSDGQEVYGTYYGEWLNASFMLILNQADSISFKILGFAGTSSKANPNPSFYNQADSYSNAAIRNTVTILKLN